MVFTSLLTFYQLTEKIILILGRRRPVLQSLWPRNIGLCFDYCAVAPGGPAFVRSVPFSCFGVLCCFMSRVCGNMQLNYSCIFPYALGMEERGCTEVGGRDSPAVRGAVGDGRACMLLHIIA